MYHFESILWLQGCSTYTVGKKNSDSCLLNLHVTCSDLGESNSCQEASKHRSSTSVSDQILFIPQDLIQMLTPPGEIPDSPKKKSFLPWTSYWDMHFFLLLLFFYGR